jgi:hypothetical protein
MDNFDLKKYLVENKVTTNSRMLTEAENENSHSAIEDFVMSHPQYEDLSPRELAKKVAEYAQEWKNVSTNYTGIKDYFRELEKSGDLL